jgi:flavin reductase (DIM6/NTAB) family NADH-FMN oxidoreductase RutF
MSRMTPFTAIDPKTFSGNAIKMIGADWMLIAAGTKTSYNMMTAAWGGLGYLWNKPIAFIFVRPSRFTYTFLENHQKFSLNFFTQKYREILQLCGSKSGREIDKMNEISLTALEQNETIYFKEVVLALLCKKWYYHDISADNFVQQMPVSFYQKEDDLHRMYIGEIVTCLQKKS